MKECNKCDTAPQFLFPSAFSCAAASVTTALRKRHMLHFRPLPLHSVTLRVTLPEPRNSFQTLASRRNVTLSRKKNRYPPPFQSFLCPDRSAPRERFFAAVLPRKQRTRVRTRPWGIRAALRGVCGETERFAPTLGGHARGWGNGIPLFREGQHRICLYVCPPAAAPTNASAGRARTRLWGAAPNPVDTKKSK